jgi:hypothetical protein
MLIAMMIIKMNGHMSVSFGGKEGYVIGVSFIFDCLSFD